MDNIKILLVEDQPIAQKLGAIILREIKCEVDTVKNGKDAIKLATTKPYALIFMDLGLPDIDGFEVTTIIRKNEKTHIAIIALTAHVDDTCKKRCQDAGIDEVISKPLTTENSKQIINKFISIT